MDKVLNALEVKQFPFSKMLKMEVPALAKLVIVIVEKHDPEVLQINEIYELLLKERPLIAKLSALYGVHPITVELKPLWEELLLYVSALKVQVKLASKSNTVETLQAANLLTLSVNTYFSKLRSSKNVQIILEKIESFQNEIKFNAELGEAADTLGLGRLIVGMEGTLVSVKRLQLERTALISQRPKEKTLVSVKSLVGALKTLFKQVEVAQFKHTELDYAPLFHELNDTIDKYRNLINIREGFNFRKAEEKKKLESGETIDDSKVSTDTEGDASTNNPATATFRQMLPAVAPMAPTTNGDSETDVQNNGVNGASEDVDLNLKRNQAVAKSAKQSQLPDLNSEADL